MHKRVLPDRKRIENREKKGGVQLKLIKTARMDRAVLCLYGNIIMILAVSFDYV